MKPRTLTTAFATVITAAALPLTACTPSAPPVGTTMPVTSATPSPEPVTITPEPTAEASSAAEEPTSSATTAPPAEPSVIEGVTTLTGGWHETTDPAAPDHGHVVTDGTYTVWLPGFPAIPFGGSVDGEKDYMDLAARGIDPAITAAQYAISITPIPRSTCSLPWVEFDSGWMVEGLSPEEFEVAAQDYVDCLVDLWRPLAAEVGATLAEDYPVHYCSAAANQDYPNCAPGALTEAAWYAYFEQDIYLGRGWGDQGQPLKLVQAFLAHEVGHLLQSELNVSGGNVIRAFTMGLIIDTTGDRQEELNAECLSAGMVADPGMSDDELRALGFLYGSDEIHWNKASSEFWTRQGIGGRVGDCNTWLASQSLLAWP